MIKRIVYISLILLILFISVVIYLGNQRGNGDNSHKTVPSVQTISADMNERLCPKPFVWFIGDRQMYDYKFETDITIDPSVLTKEREFQQEKAEASLTVQGTLNFRVFEREEDKRGLVYLGFQLSPVQVTAYEKSLSQSKRIPELEELYQTFFVATYEKEGVPVTFYFPKQLDEQDKLSLSEIVKILQVTVSSEGKEQIRQGEWIKWREEEIHATGEFEAEYSVHKDDCHLIKKRNVRCLSIRPIEDQRDHSQEILLTGHIIRSAFKGRTSPDMSWLKAFSGSETLEVRVRRKDVFSRSQAQVSLERRHFEPDPDLDIWTESRSLKEILKSFGKNREKTDTLGSWESIRIQRLREQMEMLSLPQIITSIKDAAASGMSQSGMAILAHRLRDFLEISPEEARLIPDIFKYPDLAEDAIGCILIALELNGHPESQSALRNVFEDGDQAADTRGRAIVAAGGIQKPEKELIESLFNLTEIKREATDGEELERADTALLSLGILAGALLEGENAFESQNIVERIANYLQKSENERERVMCLKALGNSSNPETIPIIESYLTSKSSIEQVASASALRNFSDEHTLHLLSDALEQSSVSDVRKAAIKSLTTRGGSEVIEYMRKGLPSEPENSLRRMMIRFLGKNRTPEVIKALEDQLERETSREVIKDIYRALYEERKEYEE